MTDGGPGAGSPPTVKDVAELAQVSAMTVSRVLAGRKHVSAEMRERVEHAAAQLGYRRNENARSIRPGHQSGLIGVTITNIANPYYAEMQQGVEEVAAAHARRILVGNSREDPDLEAQLVADFVGRRVEGLIVVPADPTRTAHLRSLQRFSTPLAFASRSAEDVDVDTVLVDDVGGSTRAVLRLLEEGHERIAFLGTSAASFTGARRLEGYLSAHRSRGARVNGALVRSGQQDVGAAERTMRDLLLLEAAPTAVFTSNNRNTVGAIRALDAHRRATGADAPLRLIGFDSFEFADLSPVPLSVVAHDARELGRRAAQMLFERVEGVVEGGSRTVELPADLVLEPRRPT